MNGTDNWLIALLQRTERVLEEKQKRSYELGLSRGVDIFDAMLVSLVTNGRVFVGNNRDKFVKIFEIKTRREPFTRAGQDHRPAVAIILNIVEAFHQLSHDLFVDRVVNFWSVKLDMKNIFVGRRDGQLLELVPAGVRGLRGISRPLFKMRFSQLTAENSR